MASPSIEQFVEFLSQEPRWYTLGIYLRAPTHELREIERNYRATEGISRCLSELYECVQRRGKSLSWERITSALEKMGNFGLAEKIQVIQHTIHKQLNQPSSVELAIDVTRTALRYRLLMERFAIISGKIREAFDDQQINARKVLQLAKTSGQCVLPPLSKMEPLSIDAVFDAIEDQCTILNYRLLVFLAESLLVNVRGLLNQIKEFTADVDVFKFSANVIEVVKLINENQQEAADTESGTIVKLKVREFWSDLMTKQFETIMIQIFQTLYEIMTYITVTQGCICLTWIIPDIDIAELIPKLPLDLEFIRIIGVISLHIGSKVIYNIEGDGCETIEAAMLQAIELKNTQAIELLLAIGCSVEVATFNGDNAMTNIVNIRPVESKESSSGSSAGGVDHVCILGHSRHVEAIVNPSSIEECSSCSENKKIIKSLHQENSRLEDRINALQQEKSKFEQRIDSLILTSCDKDAEIALLKKSNEELIEEKMSYKEITSNKEITASLRPKTQSSVFNTYHEGLLNYLEDDDALSATSKKLYPHQIEAILAVRQEFTHHNTALVVLPTGCGKSGITVLAPYVLNANKVLVITPSMTRSKQLYDDFCDNKKMFLLQRGIINKEDVQMFIPQGVRINHALQIPNSLHYSLVVANAQKFETHLHVNVCIEEIPNDSFDLVIVDEAHHYPTQTWKTIVDHFPNSKRLFLTATPYHRGEYILPHHRPPCYELTKETAIEKGIIRKIDFVEESHMTANEAISQRIHEILNQHDVEDSLHKHQAMVLSGPTNDGAEEFVQSYRDTCPGNDRCERYSGSNNEAQRAILEDFNEGEVRVLVVVGKLLEGFDRKNVSVVGIARKVAPTSKVLFSQFVGRAVHKLHTDDPVTATVVSHIDYEQRLNFQNYDKVTDGENDDEKIEEQLMDQIKEEPMIVKEKSIEQEPMNVD